MRLPPILPTCLLAVGLLTAAPVLAAEGTRAPKGEAATARAGCVAVPAAGTDTDTATPAAPRRATLVCGIAPDQGCGSSGSPSWRFRANGRPLPDWRAGCSFRTDRGHGAPVLG